MVNLKSLVKEVSKMARNMYPRQYQVFYKSKIYPNAGTRCTTIMAMNQQWIKDNWVNICQTDEYRIVKINMLNNAPARQNYAW